MGNQRYRKKREFRGSEEFGQNLQAICGSFFFIETKGNRSRLFQVSKALGYQKIKIVKAKENAGGIVQMWLQDVMVVYKESTYMIFNCVVENSEGASLWSFYGVLWNFLPHRETIVLGSFRENGVILTTTMGDIW